jgi:hypothetical protein
VRRDWICGGVLYDENLKTLNITETRTKAKPKPNQGKGLCRIFRRIAGECEGCELVHFLSLVRFLIVVGEIKCIYQMIRCFT